MSPDLVGFADAYRSAAKSAAELRLKLYGFGLVFDSTTTALVQMEAQALAIARAIEAGERGDDHAL